MNKRPEEDGGLQSSEEITRELGEFVDRCVALGMDSVKDVGEIITDPTLANALAEAADHKPLVGEPESVDAIVAEMKSIAAQVVKENA